MFKQKLRSFLNSKAFVYTYNSLVVNKMLICMYIFQVINEIVLREDFSPNLITTFITRTEQNNTLFHATFFHLIFFENYEKNLHLIGRTSC